MSSFAETGSSIFAGHVGLTVPIPGSSVTAKLSHESSSSTKTVDETSKDIDQLFECYHRYNLTFNSIPRSDMPNSHLQGIALHDIYERKPQLFFGEFHYLMSMVHDAAQFLAESSSAATSRSSSPSRSQTPSSQSPTLRAQSVNHTVLSALKMGNSPTMSASSSAVVSPIISSLSIASPSNIQTIQQLQQEQLLTARIKALVSHAPYVCIGVELGARRIHIKHAATTKSIQELAANGATAANVDLKALSFAGAEGGLSKKRKTTSNDAASSRYSEASSLAVGNCDSKDKRDARLLRATLVPVSAFFREPLRSRIYRRVQEQSQSTKPIYPSDVYYWILSPLTALSEDWYKPLVQRTCDAVNNEILVVRKSRMWLEDKHLRSICAKIQMNSDEIERHRTRSLSKDSKDIEKVHAKHMLMLFEFLNITAMMHSGTHYELASVQARNSSRASSGPANPHSEPLFVFACQLLQVKNGKDTEQYQITFTCHFGACDGVSAAAEFDSKIKHHEKRRTLSLELKNVPGKRNQDPSNTPPKAN